MWSNVGRACVARRTAAGAAASFAAWQAWRPSSNVIAEEPASVSTSISRTPRQQGGEHVYVWGRRFAIPVSKAAGGPKVPGNDEDFRTPVEAPWFKFYAEEHGCRWQQLTFGPTFGAARSDAGELFIWGASKRSGEWKYVEPRQLGCDVCAGARFKDVQCSESALWALTTDGEVIVYQRVPEVLNSLPLVAGKGDTPAGGRRVPGLEDRVRQMAIGPTHASFLTEDGSIYCLGSNRYGECGADPTAQQMASVCRKVRFPTSVLPMGKPAVGAHHTVVLSSIGLNFAWGDDSNIQLGLGDTRSNGGDERMTTGSRGFINQMKTGEPMQSAFTRGGAGNGMASQENLSMIRRTVSRSTSGAKYGEFDTHLQPNPVVMQEIPLEFERQVHGIPYPPADDVCCGNNFTLLLLRDSPDHFSEADETNRLFCCGENGMGQCGRSMQTGQQTMAAVRLPRHTRTELFAVGANHGLAVVARVMDNGRREVWSWGSNAFGQTGVPKKGNVIPPVKVKMPREAHVEGVWCAFDNSALICSHREPVVTGKLHISPED